MKIAIVLPDLSGGGAERLHVNLANEWLARGFDVDFVLMSKRGELLSLLHDSICVIDLKVSRIRNVVSGLAYYLRKSQPDVILVGMWPLTSAAVFSWILSGWVGKLFLSEHENLTLSYIDQSRVRPWLLRLLLKLTYRLANGIIAVSMGVKDDLCLLGGLSEKRIRVIYNPAAVGNFPLKEKKEVQQKLWGVGYKFHILSVGRLVLQKDHSTLIKAFSMLPSEINAKLVILGEGVMRADLTSLIAQLGLSKKVCLPGFTKDPYSWFQSADLFVLSSRWEGFGNVIVEALECGVPVVSTDCQSGPSEILQDGRYGKMVPVQDPIAMAEAIMQSLNSKHDKDDLFRRSQDFSVRKISSEYLTYMFPDHFSDSKYI